MNDSPGELQILTARVDQLEKRVRALEHPAEESPAVQHSPEAFDHASKAESVLETGSIFPILGRAMLGVAGAYILRAVAESRTSWRLAISALAVAYAFSWLIGSDRSSARVARIVYAATSALILVPMLWENTVVFHLFSPMITAGLLAAFLTLATTLELRNKAMPTIGIAQSIATIITAALAFATHEVLPFVAALLIAVFISEFARARECTQPVWPLIVLVTDITIGGVIFIYSGPQDTRADYHDLSAASVIATPLLLFAMNAGAVFVRVLVHKRAVTILETLQVVIAFALVTAAAFYLAPLHGRALIGWASLMLSAANYLCAFRYLRGRDQRSTFHVFSVWSAALLLAGSFWALPGPIGATVLGVASVSAAYFANRIEPGVLLFQANLFLLTAAALSRLPQYLYDCMAGTPPHSLPAGIIVIAICAASTAVISPSLLEGLSRLILQIVPPLIAICAITALLVQGVLAVAAAFMPLALHQLAFLRTLTICGVVLAVAYGGSLLARNALTHIAYVALAFLAAKLFFQDLRHGHMGFIAASIVIFAITLMATPKFVRLRARRQASASAAVLDSKHSVR